MTARLLLGLLLTTALPAVAQMPAQDLQAVYAHPISRPDSGLSTQAFRLAQHFEPAGWETLEASLRPRPRPVHTYLGFGPNHPMQSSLQLLAILLPPGATPEQVAFVRNLTPEPGGLRQRLYGNGFGQQFLGQSVSRQSVKQLYSHLGKLSLERRQSDYERLCSVLLRRAAKVRKLKEALPVLQFMVDSTGRVQDVAVDKSRSRMGLTPRSRKIILTALWDERFRALEARRVFSKPRPGAEKINAFKRVLAFRAKRFFTGIHFRRQLPLDPCGPHSQREARRMRRYTRWLVSPKT